MTYWQSCVNNEMEAESSLVPRALQWSGNPYGNGYGLEMDAHCTLPNYMKMSDGLV